MRLEQTIMTTIMLIVMGLLSGRAGYLWAEKNALEEAAYCEPPNPADCSKYGEVIDEWIKKYEESEDMWLQCQKDLARTQEELNHDIICTEEVCIPR